LKILAATNNKHKVEEFRNILKDTGVEIISQEELGKELPDIPEDGETFEENAGIKALGFAKFAGLTVIADDSGLEIKALDGAPGIYSARYAETNDKRIERVLRELERTSGRTGESANRRADAEKRPKSGSWQSAIENVPDRVARFVCVIALANPEKVIATFRGEVYGRIGYESKGSGGFGYDPVFIPDGYDKNTRLVMYMMARMWGDPKKSPKTPEELWALPGDDVKNAQMSENEIGQLFAKLKEKHG
jgi:XTP/dITP diphosphohydrolase